MTENTKIPATRTTISSNSDVDRAQGFYWVYGKGNNGGEGWLVLYWTGSEWQNGGEDTGTTESVGPQMQPPQTGSPGRPMGYYWIQVHFLDGNLSDWRVAWWSGANWQLLAADWPDTGITGNTVAEGDIAYTGSLLEEPSGS